MGLNSTMAEVALEPTLDVGAQSKLEDGDDDGSISLSLRSQSVRYDVYVMQAFAVSRLYAQRSVGWPIAASV